MILFLISALSLYSDGYLNVNVSTPDISYGFMSTLCFSKKWNNNSLRGSLYAEKNILFNYGFLCYYTLEIQGLEVRIGAQPVPFPGLNSYFSPAMYPLLRKKIYYTKLIPFPWVDWGIILFNKNAFPCFLGWMDGISKDSVITDAADIRKIDNNNALIFGIGHLREKEEAYGAFYFCKRDSSFNFVTGYMNLKTVVSKIELELEYAGQLPWFAGSLKNAFDVAWRNLPLVKEKVPSIIPETWGYGYGISVSYFLLENIKVGGIYENMDGSELGNSMRISFVFALINEKGKFIQRVRFSWVKDEKGVYNELGIGITSAF